MAKKKNKHAGESDVSGSSALQSAVPESQSTSKTTEPKRNQPSTSALIICRNKHWRYISSFHGPWLQLPPEVLESLANNNYALPRPRPIDPAVFFDLLKIRQLVDDATNLAVRAASGVTSASLNSTVNAGNGLVGNGGAALGLGLGGGGGHAKLSRERKHRMREQATQKLSKAYHLDEIACSVATMQSASTLEDVAQLVLQRSSDNPDAKYVHFFHEKIPSRRLADCTSLQPLDEVFAERSREAEILRTRAVTKVFKEDFNGAAHDLTLALQICRYHQSQHKSDRLQLQLARDTAADAQRNSRWREEIKLDEEDHPSSLEAQLLFHRAGVYLTIACQHVSAALPSKASRGEFNRQCAAINGNRVTSPEREDYSEMSMAEEEGFRRQIEARKVVKTNSKRALRDYVSFLSHLDYTPGLPAEVTDEYIRRVNQVANSFKITQPSDQGMHTDLANSASLSNGPLSNALVPHNGAHLSQTRRQQSGVSRHADIPTLPLPTVYQISELFSSSPPSDLPAYPETTNTLTTKQQLQATHNTAAKALLAQTDCHEALTYHPLLTDALHSLLLCHCLIQTSARELQRHAYMVARLARVCDGYPIFQAARSPSRADWIEVLRRGENWVSLAASWESLCSPAPLPGQAPTHEKKETAAEKKERLKQQAIMEALEDDRVCDEASFHAAVAARQRRQEEEQRKAEGRDAPKRWAQEDGKEYPISTERAQAVVRWIKEAPVGGGEGTKRKKKSAKSGSKGKGDSTEARVLQDQTQQGNSVGEVEDFD